MQHAQRTVIPTADGSPTISIPELDLLYHSHHGAIQESLHVFIEAGLKYAVAQIESRPLRLLEMGFGTGLNTFLSSITAAQNGLYIHDTVLEKYPLESSLTGALNYPEQLANAELFHRLHACDWGSDFALSEYFMLRKIKTDLLEFNAVKAFDLVYFDAFAPDAQPELWTEAVFQRLYHWLRPGGIVVTYCAKGAVRRALQAVGFAVSKLPGPPGKREMLRAVK